MKKLFLFCLLMVGFTIANAQQGTMTFTLVTPPCNNNGVLQANVTGLTGTITYHFYSYTTSLNVTNTTGTLTSYSGVPVQVDATAGAGTASGYYQGAPPFHYTISTVNGVCPAPSTVTATVTGGTAPFVTQWYPFGSTSVAATGATVTMPNGIYQVKITDAAGCSYGSVAAGDSIFLYGTSGLTVTTSSTVAACTNGTATVTNVTGGVGPYSYSWSNGANTAGITGLVSGQYNVTVTSAQGCSELKYIYVQQSPQITVNTTPTAATCLQNNGSATAFGAGGTAPYTYLWSNTQTTQLATGLSANGGTYYFVTATDVNGCTGRGYAYITSTTPISATYTTTSSSCTAATGSATVTATGGTTPYTITWNTFPVQTGATATGLAPGTYNFKVTDATGCVRTGAVNVPPVSNVAATISAVNATCTQTNGSAAVTITSGASPFTYSWNTSATASSITNLPAGGYSVQITDNMGCHITKSISVLASSPINNGINVTQASCIYAADGSIVVTPTGGTSPYTYSWSNGATTASLNSLSANYYYFMVSDAAGCTKSSSVYVPYNPAGTSCYCTITGTVYQDLNNNCAKDAGEPGIANIMIHASGLGYAFTNANGVYSFKAPTGAYTLSEQVQATYPLASCQNNAQAVTVTAAAGCTNTVNFANIVNPIHDMSIQTVSFNGPPVPGNNYYQHVVISNNGTATENSAISGYSNDGQLNTPSYMPGFYSANGANHYSSNSTFPALAAGASQQFNVAYSVPTNIPLATSLLFNDTVAYITPMTSWLTDYTPWNNVNAYTATVVGSFDPNDLEVSPKGTGTQGYITKSDSTLTYTIHFQNTGTYPAQKVVLVDSLSNNLQIASVKVGASNHAYTTTISEGGVMKFTFDNINLPESTSDPLGSIGYVIYTVRLKPNLAVGTQIKNSAAIYFDYNPAVITNTTLNTIKNTVDVGQVSGQGTLGMAVYPNPASDHVSINIESASDVAAANIRFVNLVGQVVLQQNVAVHRGTNVFSATTTNLTPGLYFVEVSEGANKATAKVSIIR